MPNHPLKLFVPASIVVFTIVDIAGGAELPMELIECRTLTSAVERLDCYDQLVDAHTASPDQAAEPRTAADPEPVAPTATAAPAQANPDLSQENLFGKDEAEIRQSVQEATGSEEINRIEARIAELGKSRSGRAVITLDNGQIWIQIDEKRARLSANDEVTIRRRSFGSYTLYNKNTALRVKRIT